MSLKSKRNQDEFERKQRLLRSKVGDRNISFNWHDARTSFLEGAFARGDRKLGQVLLTAWQNGAKFDGWSEYFNYKVWIEAFAANGLDPNFYATRDREFDEVMPWDHLSSGAGGLSSVVKWDTIWEQAFLACRDMAFSAASASLATKASSSA